MSAARLSRRAALALALGLPAAALAQPVADLSAPLLWAAPPEGSRLQSFLVSRGEGQVAQRMHLLVPEGPAPAAGWPLLVALDGAAVGEVLASLPPAALAGRAILAVGHDVDLRYALVERTLDYTPPLAEGPQADPAGRPAGGAAALLARLTEEILPRAEALAPLDPAARTLWGHSYGGLFALHAAFAGAPFARIVAASPSLWWDSGRAWQGWLGRVASGEAPAMRLDLHSGTAEGAPKPRAETPQVSAMLEMRARTPADALEQLDRALREAGVPGRLTLFPDLGHGAAFARSLAEVLAS
ncbi:alpha/beta hydrolase [Poseidonocella sp. HB161398]|uniref:alpha/beta hydrolase n=1 Tax=Poseidonocella sp. HB161398 TaxID=2320855 RepID=UPI001108B0DA|nr:alpha/beta hydrolase-fold protein [Poseidonocella sp. HB161398]